MRNLIPREKPQVIKVGRVIDEEGYLVWLKREFEKENPEFTVEYYPPIRTPETPDVEFQNRSAVESIEDFMEINEVDLILGGNAKLHERYSYKLGKINKIH